MPLSYGGVVMLLLFLVVPHGAFSQDDRQCLKEFQTSISDPAKSLKSWSFTDPEVNICDFFGVTCLHNNAPEVYSLKLPGASLNGPFPESLSKCHFLTSLDLSNNEFEGPISPDLCKDVPYMVSLNLKNNKFTGAIPASLGDCEYLNDLFLQHNQLSGSIPSSIGDLERLTNFNVSQNALFGIIPYGVQVRFGNASVYSGNPGLCGTYIELRCQDNVWHGLSIRAAVSGSKALLVVAGLLILWYTKERLPGYSCLKGERRLMKRTKQLE